MQKLCYILVVVALLASQNACEKSRSDVTRSTTAFPGSDSLRVQSTQPAGADTTPAGIVRRYYSAINSRSYRDAYMLWSQSGKASRKSEAEFAAGFAQTASVNISIGDSVSIEGAAGSQYATVPVVIDATLADGKQQHFVGTYTLRRSMVDGATPEQRQWRIYSATLK
jgi:hypothetical protein